MENQETLDAIAAEVRARAKAWPDPSLVQYDERLADRITDAARRGHFNLDALEREIVSRRSIKIPIEIVPTCNMAAMYEALVRVKRLFDGRLMWQPDIRKAHEAVNAALAAPPRNCDVGTAEEQFKRFDRWCNSMVLKNCWGLDCRKCFIAWSQTPYEDASETKDYSNVLAVCFDCARKAGFVQKKKAVIVLEDECGICKARRPCTDLRNDWMPHQKEVEVK